MSIQQKDLRPMTALPKLPNLGSRLRWAREERKMTQAELGKAVGLDQTSIGQIERGEIRMPREIEALGRVLGVSPAWLMFGVEELDLLTPEAIKLALAFQNATPEKQDLIRALVKQLTPE